MPEVGDVIGWNACSGDKIAYNKNGAVIHAEVIDTFPNGIRFETTDGEWLHATYQECWDNKVIFTWLRPKAKLPSLPGLI